MVGEGGVGDRLQQGVSAVQTGMDLVGQVKEVASKRTTNMSVGLMLVVFR